MEVGEGLGHTDDAVSLLITVVRGRRRPLSRPNYRRRSGNNRRLCSSAFGVGKHYIGPIGRNTTSAGPPAEFLC